MRDKSGRFVKGYSGRTGSEQTVEMDAVDEVIG